MPFISTWRPEFVASLMDSPVVDIKALCRAVADGKASTEYVMGLEKDRLTGIVSCPALNKMATALKGTMNVPGVQAMSRRV